MDEGGDRVVGSKGLTWGRWINFQKCCRIAYLETSKAYGSMKASQPPNGLQALHVYPVFEVEKLKRSGKKTVRAKNRKKRP